jgi:hypothetical protein
MARRRKPQPIPLSQVEPGDLFALPLEDGRWGACRVLRKSTDPLQVVVQTSAWIGDAPPADLNDPRLVTPLLLTHHAWGGVADLHWVSDPVPADAVRLGRLPVTAEEAAAECNSWSGWASCQIQPLLQWRWDHEREAVLAEDELERLRREAATQEARFGYQPAVLPSLQEMRRRTPFPNWSGLPSPANIRRSRRIVRELIDDLIALEGSGDEVAMLDAFRRAVERFNAAEESDDPFIETVEREDICEVLDDIADAAGLSDYDVCAWRDW